VGLCLSLFLSAIPSVAAQEGRHVNVLTLNGVIDPLSAQYVIRGINASIDDGAEALVIQMDTPGGLESSMRKIVTAMMNAPLPIIVYIAPSGARAGSAGVFITMAAHVAAMAPSTNIGAAHPVGGQGEDIPGALGEKVTNDAAAFIRTIAEKRGRNADWAEEAVRKSIAATESEAVQKKVVDFVASDLRQVLDIVDGRTVQLPGGPHTLRTAGIAIQRLDMNLQERFLHVLVDPTIAYLLLLVGFWALIAEFNNPGALLPGIVGAICLILAFVAFESLPINWGGVALIVLAVIMFVADIKAPSHGILTVGGAVAFVLGSLLLFSPFTPPSPSMPRNLSIPWPWILIMGGGTILIFTVAVGAGLRAQRIRVSAGMESMIGEMGIARTDLTPRGQVFVRSEDWTAVAQGEHIKAGENVRVVAVDGLKLIVVKA
jgi:membrane-bound serine protease (ClpP class)